MTCVHIQKIYQLCREHDIKIGSTDVVRLICGECQQIEVCPSLKADEYDMLKRKEDCDEDCSTPEETANN